MVASYAEMELPPRKKTDEGKKRLIEGKLSLRASKEHPAPKDALFLKAALASPPPVFLCVRQSS